MTDKFSRNSCQIRFKFRTCAQNELCTKHAHERNHRDGHTLARHESPLRSNQSLTEGTLKDKHFVQVRHYFILYRYKYFVYAWIKFKVEVAMQ